VKRVLLVLACLALGSLPAHAQFSALETRDLRLVYAEATQSFIAPYTAQCFERSLRFYRDLFDYKPSEKVTVILSDAADYANAGVWVSPRNSMFMHLAPMNFVYETGPANERINFNMNHELAHVVTLDKAAGSERFFRGLFNGKVGENAQNPESMLYSYLTSSRRASPRWFREGAAVFFETWMAGGLGRAQGPWDEMVFRAMVLDSTHFWDPLGLESEGVKTDFQIGVNSYLYGTRFLSYLAWKHGPESVVRWVDRGKGSRGSYAAEFRRLYGRSLDDTWRDWIEWEKGFQRANLDSLGRYPVTPYRDLSARALGSVSRGYVDSTSRTLLTAVFYPGALAHIAGISLASGVEKALAEVKGPALYFVSSVAWDPAERRLFYTTDNNEWRDLHVLEMSTGRTRQLLRDERLGDLAFNRADSSLWAVRHFNGYSTIVRLPSPWTDYSQVLSLPYGTDVYDLDFSPDGKQLVCSMGEISGRQTLRLMDVAALAAGDTTTRTLQDFGSSIPSNFVFSPDARYLYGSSYYTGVSNIFRYDLARDSMDIVTNTQTGFFRPIPLGGDSLIVFRYTGDGFVPTLLKDATPLTDVNAINFLGAELIEKYPVLETWKVPPPSSIAIDSMITYRGAYGGLAWVRPTTVYPIVQSYRDHVSVGGRVNLSDPISQNLSSLTVTYTPDETLPENERLHVGFSFEHNDFTAKLRLNPASFYDLFGPTKSSRKGFNAGLEWNDKLIDDKPRTLDLTLEAGGWTGLRVLPDYQNVDAPPSFRHLLSTSFDLSYKNLRSSIGAIDAEKGYQWRLSGALDGVRFEQAGTAEWKRYPSASASYDIGAPLPVPNTSLWIRTAAGGALGDHDDPFANFYFGGFGNNWVDYQNPKRYRAIESFPGLDLQEVGGNNFAKAMLDLNLPPLRFARLGRPNFYVPLARLGVFGGTLVTDPDKGAERRTLTNLGAQLDVRLQVLLNQTLTLSAGYARAFEGGRSKGDEFMVSLKIL
jgi:hypothetical protein